MGRATRDEQRRNSARAGGPRRAVTFRAFSREYMRLRRAKKSSGDFPWDAASLKPLMKAFGEMNLRDLNHGHIQRYIERRLTARRKWRARPRTVNAELAMLTAIFEEAEKRRLVELTYRMRSSLRPGPTFGPPGRA